MTANVKWSAREWSVLGSRDIDGQPERAREREGMSQLFRSVSRGICAAKMASAPIAASD